MSAKRLVRWLKWKFWPAKPDAVPFSDVPAGEAFWWEGACYIKETEYIIFLREPMPRPFAWRTIVRVYPPGAPK